MNQLRDKNLYAKILELMISPLILFSFETLYQGLQRLKHHSYEISNQNAKTETV